jgi:hypothetical protein
MSRFRPFVVIHTVAAFAFAAAQAAAQAPPPSPGTPRLGVLDVPGATLAARYRLVESRAGALTTNQLQSNVALKLRVNVDSRRRLALHAGIFTGSSFTGGWNNTGVGTGERSGALFVKQLYVAAVPVAGVEVSAGGLYPQRGESTEITSYDNDGYLAGGRVAVRRPRHVFFDEVAVTTASIGDTATPNVFSRLDQMTDPDYGQLLVAKRVAARVTLSADYTRHAGRRTWRQAAAVTTRGVAPVDTVRLEQYHRVGAAAAYGLAVHAEKAATGWLGIGGGFASIDPDYGGLNADRFQAGTRLFLSSTASFARAFTLTAFAARTLNDGRTGRSHRTRVDVVLAYNVLKGLAPARK